MKKLIKRAAASYADAAYVSFWQAAGLLNRHSSRRFERPDNAKQMAVVIIPGVYEAWHFVERLAAFLHKAGYPVYLIKELGYNNGAIPLSALAVRGYLDEITEPDIVLVGHSKGGLIGKYLLTRHNKDNRVRHLIAINSPFNGSIYAHLMFIRSLRVFTPRSPIIKELQKNKAVNVRITSIYSSYDPYIPASSQLDSAENIRLEATGHFKILADKRLHTMILDRLQKPPT